MNTDQEIHKLYRVYLESLIQAGSNGKVSVKDLFGSRREPSFGELFAKSLAISDAPLTQAEFAQRLAKLQGGE